MTLPNWLSVARILLVPIVVVLLMLGFRGHDVAAAAIFIVASLTDTLDGRIARARGTTTTFGAFIDPLADKLLVACALIALVDQHRLWAWAAMVIIAREFAVTGLRLVAAKNVVIVASQLGKMKTTVQMIAIVVLILDVGPSLLGQALVVIAVCLTLISGWDYFRASWRHLEVS